MIEPEFIGAAKTITEISKELNKPPIETFFDLLIEGLTDLLFGFRGNQKWSAETKLQIEFMQPSIISQS